MCPLALRFVQKSTVHSHSHTQEKKPGTIQHSGLRYALKSTGKGGCTCTTDVAGHRMRLWSKGWHLRWWWRCNLPISLDSDQLVSSPPPTVIALAQQPGEHRWCLRSRHRLDALGLSSRAATAHFWKSKHSCVANRTRDSTTMFLIHWIR